MAKNKTKAAKDAEEIGSSKELYNSLLVPISSASFAAFILVLAIHFILCFAYAQYYSAKISKNFYSSKKKRKNLAILTNNESIVPC